MAFFGTVQAFAETPGNTSPFAPSPGNDHRFFPHLGIKAGMNVSYLSSTLEDHRPFLGYDVADQSAKHPYITAFQIGVFTTVRINNRLEFQPELFYATRGRTYCIEYVYDHLLVKLKYLELSALTKALFLKRKLFNSFILAGPFIGYNIHAEKVRVMWHKEDEHVRLDNVRAINYGLVGGIGTEFRAPFGILCLDARGNVGLANLMSRVDEYSQVPTYSQDGSIKDYTILFLVGFKF